MNRFAARELATYNTEISDGAHRLYHALDEHARDSGTCWPHQRGLAAKIGCTVRELQRRLAELVTAGMCAVERTAPGRGNRYVLYHTTARSSPHDQAVATLTTARSSHKKQVTEAGIPLTLPIEPKKTNPDRCWYCHGQGEAGAGSNRSACGICGGSGVRRRASERSRAPQAKTG